VVLGGPDYDAAEPREAAAHAADRPVLTGQFPPLDGARREAEAVASVLGVEAITGPDATKQFLSAVSNPRVLHIATHGYFAPPDAAPRELSSEPLLRSGLALAGANVVGEGQRHTGILTAEEVLSLNLAMTELTVLSSCETGLGDVEHGEGLASLARCFQASGAWSTLIALWRVPDQETSDLVDEFYRRIARGESRAEALRQAKILTRQRYPPMQTWAGFLLFGVPGPIDELRTHAE